jgi:hypothetical protein
VPPAAGCQHPLDPLLNHLAAGFTMGFLSVTTATSTTDLTCPSPAAAHSEVSSSPTFISPTIPDVKSLAVEDGSHHRFNDETTSASRISPVQSVIPFAPSTEGVSDPTVQNRCYWIEDNMIVLLVSNLPCTESNKIDIQCPKG